MKTLYEKMRDNRSRWIKSPIKASKAPFMVVNGVAYLEKPEASCKGCEFESGDTNGCLSAQGEAKKAFGSSCGYRSVIYIKAK